jgi:Core-2/I-Branching enzyme
VTVAYLVISHRRPEQVLRLVRALKESPSAEVVVRHDQRREPLNQDTVEAAGGHLLDDGIEVEWGGWSYLMMVLRALEWIEARLAADWVLVLSGQDYPLRPIGEIEAFLAGTDYDALLGDVHEVDFSHRPEPPADEFFLRYGYGHYQVELPPWLLYRLVPGRLRPLAYAREMPPPLTPRLGFRRWRLPFGPDLRCYVSSDWITVSRHAARVLIAFARRERKAVRYFRRTVIPSEAFFASVLLSDRSLRVDLDHRRFISFPQQGRVHPETLTVSHLDRMLASGADFARKFDERADAAVLDALDRLRAATPTSARPAHDESPPEGTPQEPPRGLEPRTPSLPWKCSTG